MRTSACLTLLSTCLLFTACGTAQEANQTEDLAMSDHDMSAMEDDADAKIASATGTVIAIDAAANTITIDHEPVPALEWPQMVMAFDADDQIRSSVAVDDKIEFEFNAGTQGNVITSIKKR